MWVYIVAAAYILFTAGVMTTMVSSGDYFSAAMAYAAYEYFFIRPVKNKAEERG